MPRLDVLLGAPSAGDVTGRVVAVVDVLRASTTIAAALHAGARRVIPCATTAEATRRAAALPRGETLLAGERAMLRVDGFDLGNSPRDFTAPAVAGKTVVLATTNGTVALAAVHDARDVIVASYVNVSAAAAFLAAGLQQGHDVTVVCAGRDGRFSLEDSAFAGTLARRGAAAAPAASWSDSARACALLDREYEGRVMALFADSEHGRALALAGFTADLALCADVDAFPVLPVYADGEITSFAARASR